MNHEKTQDLFALYLDNKLDSNIKIKVEKHLHDCQECSSFLNEFKSITKSLRELGQAELPKGYFHKLDIKIDAEKVKKPGFFRIFTLQRVLIPAFGVFFMIVGYGFFASRLNRPNIRPLKTFQIQTENKVAPKTESPSRTMPIETKKSVEFAKAGTKKDFILRGSGAKYVQKKIIKQWQDTSSGITAKKSVIIENQMAWKELWEAHTKNISPLPQLPDVDFNICLVVAVFMGEQKSGGYGIAISKVEESQENIYIEFTETVPAPGAIVSQQLSQPYHIVVLEKE